MKYFFFLVSGLEKYKDAYGYHDHFFQTSGGFLWAIGAAFVVALVCAIVFYFGLCNSRKTFKAATMPVWVVTLIITGVVTFLFTSQVLIGHGSGAIGDDEEEEVDAAANNGASQGKLHNFYVDMEQYYNQSALNEDITSDELDDRLQVKEEIIENLNQGEDVAMLFNLNATLYALLFFYIISLILKGFTKHGIMLPHKWPHK